MTEAIVFWVTWLGAGTVIVAVAWPAACFVTNGRPYWPAAKARDVRLFAAAGERLSRGEARLLIAQGFSPEGLEACGVLWLKRRVKRTALANLRSANHAR